MNNRTGMKSRMNHSTQASKKANERGFSLIEVTVAILILTVGLLSLAQMMVLATNSNTLSGRMTSCSALAREQLERLRAAPFYTNPAACTQNPVLIEGGGIAGPAVPPYAAYYDQDGIATGQAGSTFEVMWQINRHNASAAMPLRMLSINVRCRGSQGNNDAFAIIGEANFTTFRTANVGGC